MEYKHNTLIEAYDVGDHRLVREGERLRIERVAKTPRPRHARALFRGSMLRAMWWALRFVLISAASMVLLSMFFQFLRAL